VSEPVPTVKGPAGVTTVKAQGTSITPVTEGHSPTVPVGGATAPGSAGTVGEQDKSKARGNTRVYEQQEQPPPWLLLPLRGEHPRRNPLHTWVRLVLPH